MMNPTLKKTAINYLKTYFIFDLIATGAGSLIFFITRNVLLASTMKLARLVRIQEIGVSLYFLIQNCFATATTQRIKVY